tara:strand:- start:801 stop:1766 length:966 start_codon:yes stop_codon:yes gene_type:complete
MNNKKLGIVMDPIATINPKKDSSLAMLLAAQDRGFELFYFTQSDLLIDEGKPYGFASALTVENSLTDWFTLEEAKRIQLNELDVILMRVDPPVDQQFIYTTIILEAAEKLGTLIVNKPSSLRSCNEKIFATEFPQCCPKTIITSKRDVIKDFHRQNKDIILKPLDGMGGKSIFRAKEGDLNLAVIIETLTDNSNRSILAQKYIPEISQGDKRILLINGEPIKYCLARMPSKGETRGNLAAGGVGRVQKLSENDLQICSKISPKLKDLGLFFVGIDVIGDYLTEINCTSPTCIREINDQSGIDASHNLMDFICLTLSKKKST